MKRLTWRATTTAEGPDGSERSWRPRMLTCLIFAAGALASGACTNVDVPESLPGPTTATTAAPGPPAPAAPDCGDPTASLRPSGNAGPNVPSSSYMAEIQARGSLRVGVDVSTLLFSSVDPITGQFVGFDIDIAKEVALALFGSADSITFVAIPYSDRLAVLEDGRVDLVADTFTINCRRRQDIAFSSEYFTSGQRLLVRNDNDATTIDGLGADARVCAAAGSTSVDNINALPDPKPEVVTVTEQADCLVLLQQSRVDAISTDDTILAGFAFQDPNVQIVGPAFSSEPYGLGLPPGHDEWVRYVNAVLEDVRDSGRWDAIYETWLADVLGPDPGPPTATYAD
jgi:polar amino acid transport system substrate-binding protein